MYARLTRLFDDKHGGFGRAPKFPQVPATTGFLARFAVTERRALAAETSSAGAGTPESAEVVFSILDAESQDASLGIEDGGNAAMKALDMAAFTMGRIYAGGVHDHVGGGVARYSVDARWHVPHFEKMLYVYVLSFLFLCAVIRDHRVGTTRRSCSALRSSSISSRLPPHLTVCRSLRSRAQSWPTSPCSPAPRVGFLVLRMQIRSQRLIAARLARVRFTRGQLTRSMRRSLVWRERER